jgi:hypothetical protein
MSWRNSRLSIWRPLASSVASAVGLILIPLTPGLANAAPPVREPSTLPTNQEFPLQDTLGSDPCGFPVLLELTTNKEVIATFTRQSGVTSIHTTGALKARLTNSNTGKTIERNISGPIFQTVNSDGSVTQKTTGPGVWAFDPTVAQGLPRISITKGKTESVFSPTGAFTWISQHGSYEDVCAALAP